MIISKLNKMADSSKKLLSVEALIPGGKSYGDFLPLRMEEVSFSASGEIYRYKMGDAYFAKSVSDDALVWTFSLSDLNDCLGNFGVEAQTSLPLFHFWESESAVAYFRLKGVLCFVDCYGKQILRKIDLDSNWENLHFNEKKRLFSFTSSNAIYLLNEAGEATLVFQPKHSEIFAGAVPSRNEFGIEQGAFWSPDGNRLAFYLVDQSAVTSYPLVKIQKPIASMESIKYPMVGTRSESVAIAIYDLRNASIVHLPLSDWAESYLACVTWSPDSEHLYLAEVNRSQKHSRLRSFSAFTGRFEAELFDEIDEKYVEPQHPLFFLPDGRFVWQSRRDGYNHLYLYEASGAEVGQLTKGDFEVTQLCGFSEHTGEILFLSTCTSPLNRDLCAVKLDGSSFRILSKELGAHSVAFSSKNGYFIDSFSAMTIPAKSVLANLKSGGRRTLHEASDPYAGYDLPVTEVGSYLCEGDEIFYRIVRPTVLREGVRYPLAVYVYGGPHVQLIRNEWLAGTKGFEYMMAQAGYVVFSIDPHGSDNRGKAFEQRIWRNIGAVQMEDYRHSIEWILREKSYVDPKRMGVYGWSFGGFMAMRLMLRNPGLFRLGVAGGAVVDWSLYEVMYTERYMETPAENPDGFAENDLNRYAENLSGDLLLIHCDNDPVVLWQNTLSFLGAAVAAGKQADYAVYPGHAHNVQGPDRVHLMQRIKRYFDDRLLQ